MNKANKAGRRWSARQGIWQKRCQKWLHTRRDFLTGLLLPLPGFSRLHIKPVVVRAGVRAMRRR